MNGFRPSVKPFAPRAGRWRERCISVRWFALLGVCVVLSTCSAYGTDASLQNYVRTLMRGRPGVALVTNPATGEILALTNAEMAFEHAFPPGSTAKIVAAATALEEGLISPRDHIFCHRVPPLLGEAFHCSHPQPGGPFTLTGALANSCNYFFAALSTRLTAEALAHGYARFGFGSPVAGPNATGNAGQIRVDGDAAAKAQAALGERTILVTPAQLLLAYSAIATRGTVLSLWQGPPARHPSPLRRVDLRPETFDTIEAGLEECVRSGTGQGAAVEGVRVAGKTGTSRNPGRHGGDARVVCRLRAGGCPGDRRGRLPGTRHGRARRGAAGGKDLRRYFALARRTP